MPTTMGAHHNGWPAANAGKNQEPSRTERPAFFVFEPGDRPIDHQISARILTSVKAMNPITISINPAAFRIAALRTSPPAIAAN